MVELERVGYRIGQKWLVRNIDLKIEAGQFWIFVGPNGAGKSTLLRLISGELAPTTGWIRFFGEPIGEYSPQELARKRAYLQQKRDVNFPFRASEIVLLGRHPYLNGTKESATDLAIAGKRWSRYKPRCSLNAFIRHCRVVRRLALILPVSLHKSHNYSCWMNRQIISTLDIRSKPSACAGQSRSQEEQSSPQFTT